MQTPQMLTTEWLDNTDRDHEYRIHSGGSQASKREIESW